MAGPSEGGGMLEVVGAQRRDVLTAGDVAETERDALGNVSEGAGPLDEAGDPAATAKGRPSRPDAPEGGLGDKLSQPAGDRRAAAAMRSRVDAAKLAIAREAVSQLDDSEELEGASGMYDAGRAAKKAAGRLRQRKAKKAAQGSRKAATALGAPKGGARGPEAAGANTPAKHQAAQAAAQASGEAARAAGSKGAASAIAGAVSGAAPALLGAVAGIVAFVACALAVAQLLSALFGFWDDAASKQGLEGLPPYITYEMVEAALECQEEYGHPAGCTIAQIIQESGQGDRMSQLAERDHNLFGMKWWSGYAGCPEVAGKANWATSEEYVPGEHTQITASFIRFTGDAECIRFRSRVFLQAERYSGNALIREAIERHDSDRMAEGLKDAGWATDSSYVESLKSIMAQWGLYRLDSMTVEDLKDSTANGNAIVEAAYSQLGVPYVWGGSTPGKALDCSGLTQYCYAQAGIRISHYTGSQYEELRRIPLSEAKPGDILYRSGHVAIYIGDDRYIHEPRTGDVCRIASGIGSFSCARSPRDRRNQCRESQGSWPPSRQARSPWRSARARRAAPSPRRKARRIVPRSKSSPRLQAPTRQPGRPPRAPRRSGTPHGRAPTTRQPRCGSSRAPWWRARAAPSAPGSSRPRSPPRPAACSACPSRSREPATRREGSRSSRSRAAGTPAPWHATS